ADLAQALALAPGHADARFAACFAELPVIYRNESEIAQCRAAYEQKLRELLNDVERGVLKGDLIKAIGARHPFLLAYQGSNDRALQQIYGETPPPPCKNSRVGCSARGAPAVFPRRPRPPRRPPASRSASASSAVFFT